MSVSPGQIHKGLLHPQAVDQKFTLRRYEPSRDTGDVVQHYWVVRWDLRGQTPYRQTVLSHPNVNLVFEKERTFIYGVAEKTSSHLLQGNGVVVGLKFRPGGFYPFWRQPVSRLTGRSVAFQHVFGVDCRPLEEEILARETPEQAVGLLDAFLQERLPPPDPSARLAGDIVYAIRDDRSLTKVEDVVRRSGLQARTLQRLFDRCVGVGPKWVLRRYRLHEAAERMILPDAPGWLELSLELGYYDQSHFIRDFKAVVGVSPEEYVRQTMCTR